MFRDDTQSFSLETRFLSAKMAKEVKFDSHSDHLKKVFQSLLKSKEFTDVTLVCDDKKILKAHKFVLCANSAVFKNIIDSASALQDPPVIYLRGINHVEMESILEFIYTGETRTSCERMSLLMNVAKDLEVENFYSNNKFNTISKSVNLDSVNSEENMKCDENTGDLQLIPSSTECEEDMKSEYDIKTIFSPGSEGNTRNAAISAYKMKAKDVLNLDTFDNMKRIMKESRKNGTRECPKCNKQFTNYQVMVNHLGSAHLNVKFPCNLCEYQGTTIGHLRTHIQIKHEGLILQCDKCEYQANRKDKLRNHIQSKHERIKFDCNMCAYQAPRKDKLKRHIQTIHEKITFICDSCDYQANRRDKLNSHLKLMH